MIQLFDIVIEDNKLYTKVVFEGDTLHTYNLVFSIRGSKYELVNSDIPDTDDYYKRQVIFYSIRALSQHTIKDMPKRTMLMWY